MVENERPSIKTEIGMHGFDNGNFSAFEHTFVLGSGTKINGELINVRNLASLAKRGDVNAYKKLFTPLNILTGKKEQEVVARERDVASRSTGRMDFLQFIDVDKYLHLSENGLHVWLEPSQLNPKTGLVVPRWKLRLIKTGFGFVNNSDVLDSPEVVNGFGEWLELGGRVQTSEGKKIEVEDCFRILSLNFPEPKGFKSFV